MTDEEKKQATPEEKQRDIPTPENWHWKITPEDIEKIKANDRDTINRVYFDNLPKFAKVAGKYVHGKRAMRFSVDKSIIEDIKQQFYIDLPTYNFTNALTLYSGLRRTCANLVFGRSVLTDSIDEQLFDEGRADTFENRYLTDDSGEKAVEIAESEKTVLLAVKNQRFLTRKQKDRLTAYAFHVRVYDGIFISEYERAFPKAV